NDTNTNSTPNTTSGNAYYYNISDAAVNLTISRDGYINSTNNTDIQLNTSTQAIVSSGHNFTLRVTDICTELGRTGDCFTIDGTMVDIDVHGLAQTNVTYSGGDAYINVSNRVPNTEITLNASKDGFVNRSIAVRVNQTNQTTVVFNSTSATGATTNRTDGLNFTVRVYAVYDELGARNFTINATDRLGQLDGGGVEAGIDVFGQLNQSNYFGPWAYVNATGTAPIVISAYLGNQSFVNSSVEVTPNATRQTLLLFNSTNNVNADVLASGLRYITKVTVTDELSSARFFTAENNTVTIALNISQNGIARTTDVNSSNVFYFSNQTGRLPGYVNVTVARPGFINTSSVDQPINATNQSTLTIQMPFNLKVATQDELANDFQASAVNFSLNNSILDSGFAYVNMSKRGWIDNSTNSSGITMTPINTSLQALANVSLAYTVRVDIMCDELNATCFNINGSTDWDGSGGAAASGIITNYSAGFGGRAFIAAPNGTNTSITAFARGYVNTSTWFIPDASSRNATVAFNTTPNSTTGVNASALPFTVRVISLCTETNSTCLNINGSLNLPSYGGVELAGNTSRYRNSIGYIPVPRTSSVTITVFGPGYVNASNTSVTPTSGTVPINVTFNATTTALKYSLIVNMTDEVNGTGNMGTGLRMTLNGTPGAENKDFFRNSSTSNIYYLNATNSSLEGSANLTFSRDGYINLTRNNTPVNSASQASLSIGLPFSVKVTLQNSDGGTITGLRAVVVDGGSPSGTFKATDGNTTGTRNGASISGDTNTSADGFIYWALNQSNVSGTVDAYVEDGTGVYKTWNSKTGQNINFTTQLSLISANSLEFFSDNTVPTITIVAPTNTSNVTTTTPAFTFIVYDNSSVSGNSGVKFDSIFVNNSGFNRDNDCTIISAYNVTCTSTLALLTDSANNTIIVTAQDRALNNATRSITYVGVDTLAGVTATLNTSDTSGIADGTYANGWSFTFNITLGSSTSNATDVNATAVKVANWTCTSCSTSSSIITTGNTIMNYTISNGTAATYYVSHDYNTTDTIYPLRDLHSTSVPINGTVTVYVKIPAATLPGTYSTTFTFGSWSVALTGGNPS
ncbi:MAG: hypothetical protein HYS62_02195, partial [Candidatus Aenigmarchaeota archaeon]|nr:hypothetical protein [Candidatus Aenigmarchaeota archaeon]